jgi:hypothetical protein
MGVLKTFEAAKKLWGLSFFKRYTPEVIKEFLPKINIDIVKKNKLIFINKRENRHETLIQSKFKDDYYHKSISRQSFYERHVKFDRNRKVYIVLSGWVVAKDHDNDVLLPQTLAKFTEGNLYSLLFRWHHWCSNTRWGIIK